MFRCAWILPIRNDDARPHSLYEIDEKCGHQQEEWYMLTMGFAVVWLTALRLLSSGIDPNQRGAKRDHR